MKKSEKSLEQKIEEKTLHRQELLDIIDMLKTPGWKAITGFLKREERKYDFISNLPKTEDLTDEMLAFKVRERRAIVDVYSGFRNRYNDKKINSLLKRIEEEITDLAERKKIDDSRTN